MLTLDWLRGLDPLVIYAVIALLATLESAALTGLVVPGDTALLVAAAVVVEAGGSPGVLVLAAAGGAIVGDSVGYEIGRALSHRDHGRLQRLVASPSWGRAESMIDRHGALAIIGGRFVAVVRTIVPVAAGTSGMRYRRFLGANVIGALIWASVHVTVGALAGESLARFEGASRYATGIVLALIAGAVVVRALRRRAARGVTVAQVDQVIDVSVAERATVGGAVDPGDPTTSAPGRVSSIGGGASANALTSADCR